MQVFKFLPLDWLTDEDQQWIGQVTLIVELQLLLVWENNPPLLFTMPTCVNWRRTDKKDKTINLLYLQTYEHDWFSGPARSIAEWAIDVVFSLRCTHIKALGTDFLPLDHPNRLQTIKYMLTYVQQLRPGESTTHFIQIVMKENW